MNKKRLFKSNMFTLVMVLVLVIAVFSFLNQRYLTVDNLINIFNSATTVGLLAIGQTYLIIAGHIDLSEGAVGAFAGTFMALLLDKSMAWPLALLLVILVGVLAGSVNSLLVNKFALQPFIATLAIASVFEGFAYIICNGRSIGISNGSFIRTCAGKLGNIPVAVIILVVLFLIFGLLLAKTTFGRSIYMIGGNATAARLAGLNPKVTSTILYIINGCLAAFAGVVLSARMHSGAPTAVIGCEFDAITAAVLGGVAFTGGIGTMGGCFIGLIIIQCFNNGLTVTGVSSFWQIVAQGLLLIGALVLDHYRRARLS